MGWKGKHVSQENILTLWDQMENIFRGMGSDEIPIWLWDPRIPQNGRSLEMEEILRRLQHNQWDLGGKSNLHFLKSNYVEQLSSSLHGELYGGCTYCLPNVRFLTLS